MTKGFSPFLCVADIIHNSVDMNPEMNAKMEEMMAQLRAMQEAVNNNNPQASTSYDAGEEPSREFSNVCMDHDYAAEEVVAGQTDEDNDSVMEEETADDSIQEGINKLLHKGSDKNIGGKLPIKKSKSANEEARVIVKEEEAVSADNILKGIIDDMEPEDKGTDLPDLLADVLGKLAQKPLTKDTTQLAEKYLPPPNCKQLGPTRVNEVIWSMMDRDAQKRDFEASKEQAMAAAAMSSLARAMEIVQDTSAVIPALTPAFQIMIDSFKFMAHVNRACNIKRRVKIREQLHPNYKHLCSMKVPITDMLFGDSIEERIRSQADANKMRDQLSKVNTGRVERTYRRSNYNFGGRSNNNYSGRSNYISNEVVGQQDFRRGRGQARGRGSYRSRGQQKGQSRGYPPRRGQH